ncbi:MAG: alcohol dehydrogenase catalytic domain-containing protein [Candidatus Bipolaricaulota bacterium]|nr:MAG: alcohol dehydrogenase catalytic domain-containing protein [Candidatus Bipolaricaulota bacterium]
MKAMVYTEYGPPDVVLELQEVEKPTPKENEVLVQVCAASVNYCDWSFVRGKPFIVRPAYQGLFKPKNTILGADIAGRVEAVGANVTQFQPGDEVFGEIGSCGLGGFAEYVAVPEDALALKPANLTFEGAAAVSGETIERSYKRSNDGCFACPVRCSRQIRVDDPRYADLAMEGPEYEPLAGFTARVGVTDLPLALHAVDRCNRLGLDAITTSEVIAWSMELTQCGLLSRDEAHGLDLRFGAGESVLALIEAIATREGLGDLLAGGVRAAAERLGRGAEIAMHVKGLELFQADVRAMKGYALGNAVSSRGADHLRSEPWFEFSGDETTARSRFGDAAASHRLAWKGKGRLVACFEEMAAVCDALGMCKNLYNNMGVLDWDETAEILSAVVGGRWSGEDVQQVGERIVNLERELNRTWGIDRRDDTLPARFLREPAGPADSPSSGSIVELAQMLDEYYQARGWDRDTGLPTREKLQALGLEVSD